MKHPSTPCSAWRPCHEGVLGGGGGRTSPGTEKGSLRRRLSLERSLESRNDLGRILLSFPHSGRSLESLDSRSLRNGNKIFRQSNLHFQIFIVVALPTTNSVFGRFSSLPSSPPPLKSEYFIFIVVSPSLNSLESLENGVF